MLPPFFMSVERQESYGASVCSHVFPASEGEALLL